MSVGAVVVRLTDETGGFTTVSAGSAAEAPEELAAVLPGVYVSPGKIMSHERAGANRVSQRRETDFILQIVCNVDDFDALHAEVDGALLGFQITAEHEPMVHVEGGPSRSWGTTLLFETIYSTAVVVKE